MRDKVVQLIDDIVPGFDPDEKELIDRGVLSSLDVLQITIALEDEFGIAIPAAWIKPSNLNSVDGIVDMVEKLSKES